MADQLATSAQVKARLGVTDVTDDTVISEMLDQVSDWIQSYCNRKLVPENTATYTFDTEHGYVLRIPKGIRNITSMGVSTTHQPDSGGTYTTIPASDRLLRPKSADLPIGWPATEVRFSRGTLTGSIAYFCNAENGATITGDFGFAATPPEIQSVCIDAVVAAYQSRQNGASSVIGAEDTAIAPWVHFFSTGSPQRATLNRYRYYGMG